MTDENLTDWNYSILRDALGYTQAQIEEASDVICGRMTLEGAPFLKDEHLPVFDCATRPAVSTVHASSVRSHTST